MVERFKGEEGHRRLVDALRRQTIVQSSEDNPEEIAQALAEVSEVIGFEEDDAEYEFITQEASDNDIYFILAGDVSVRINGRERATRDAGSTVGEMATIDTSAPRSASVHGNSGTVLAKVTEPDFSRISRQYPDLWRQIALEMGNRLRGRGVHEAARNEEPWVFVGSSVEGLPVAEAIGAGLDYAKCEVRAWPNAGFPPSSHPLDDLLRFSDKYDYAVIVLTGDDKLISAREDEQVERSVPRDNCIFELGMFYGAFGRKNTFYVQPRGVDLKLPSDLHGITPLTYKSMPNADRASLKAALSSVCGELREIMNAQGPR